MKSLYFALWAAMLLLTGCDPVAADRRLIEVPAATIQRNVLIEDFTGQRCIFCPEATEVITQLQARYTADQLIAVAIHAGPLAIKAVPGFVGLRTEVGDAYYKQWAVPNVPKAIINRRGGVLAKEDWAGRIYDEFARKTTVGIALNCQYNPNTRRVEIETQATTLNGEVKGRLQLWLVEDGIVAPQLFPHNKTEKNYVHNHVLRAAVNGDWGTELTLSPHQAQKERTSYTLPADIVPEKAWVVAFVYNDDGVLQAVRKKITLP